ncbi:ABC transporter permease [Paenibacillus wenxiniae]|uniref:ABC transporter permease n=1 Tax=Paenibacillus wenxiniae TaxID=1636843 RepID=A0ABW4REV0_9BACL
MTFRQFAFNNVLRNKRLYAAYFLSSMFTVMIFFTFAVFAYHPALSGSDVNHTAQTAMSTSKWLIYGFSFFFVLYSMGSFLKTRKREFGLLMLQGMSQGQLRRMVFMENMLIGFGATIGGIVLGLVFAKAILLIGENILVLSQPLNFYLPIKAIGLTILSFMVLFVLISLFISTSLRSSTLIQLIRSKNAAKSEPRASVLLSLLVVILLVSSYALALMSNMNAALQLLLPIVIMVSMATYLLFTQLSVYLIRAMKKRKRLFWRKTNMLLFSDLSYRMKDNARTFFLVTMVSTVAFCAIGTLYGFQSVLNKGASSDGYYSIAYYDEPQDKQFATHVQMISDQLKADGVAYQVFDQPLNRYGFKDGLSDLTVLSNSEFNQIQTKFGEQPIQVTGNQAVLLISDENNSSVSKWSNRTLETTSGIAVQSGAPIVSSILPGASEALIIPDNLYAQIGKPKAVQHTVAWKTNTDQDKLLQTERNINTLFAELDAKSNLAIPAFTLYQVQALYGISMFIGLFIGIVFFVSAGSFLYFRLYSDLDEDKEKFRAIAKLGLTERELNRVLTRQIALLFFTPIVVALVHGAVALTTLSHMLERSLVQESAFVLSIFFLIQLIYFFIVKFFYIKQIRAALH